MDVKLANTSHTNCFNPNLKQTFCLCTMDLSPIVFLFISQYFSTLPYTPSHCSQEFHNWASGPNLDQDIDSLSLPHIQMCNVKLVNCIVCYSFGIMNLQCTFSEQLLTHFHIYNSQCNNNKLLMCLSNS